ncbi:MAG: PQQ-binding-like beta-propeller repeat protein [Candidatus Sabulitectum sp.]|nr:PQQ-binding-like beta-propeller repeat protein [Candidatus Sabulitectum sp.]
MRAGFFCFLLLGIAAVSAYGGEPEILWSARFPDCGGSVVWDAAETSLGGYVAVGEICHGTAGKRALNVCRVDSGGLVLWENTALSLGNASAYSIEGLVDGYAICGVCSDSSGKQGLVLKIDANGNTAWSVDIGYENDDALFDLCLTPAGNILAVGYSFNTETSDNDILAVCVSDSGSVLWRKRYVAPEYQSAYSVTPSIGSDREFILTGSDGGNIFLMKINEFGNWQWKTSHLLEGNQTGRSVTTSSEGGYIVAGSTRGSSGFSDILLVFFDEDGKVISEHVWGAGGPDNAYSIQEVSPAGFVVLVNSNSGTGEGYRPYIFRFDPWLSVVWSVKITDRNALCYSLMQTLDGGFIVTGKISAPEGGTDYSSCVIRLSAEDLLNWE